MAKIDLNTVSSGYLSQAALNNNFTAIEDELQNKVLYRNNPAGEPNSMQNHLDMNGFNIINAGNITGTGVIDPNGIPYELSASGATVSTVQAKLSQYVSLTDFGAVGDGNTDDSQAILSAINYVMNLGGGTIHVPKGKYKITQTIYIPKGNVRFQGESFVKDNYTQVSGTFANAEGTVFEWGGATTSAAMVHMGWFSGITTRKVSGSSFNGIALNGNNKAGTGLKLISTDRCEFKDVLVQKCIDYGVLLTTTKDTIPNSGARDTQHNYFETLFVELSASAIGVCLDSDVSATGNSSCNMFNNVFIRHKNNDAVRFGASDSNTFNHLRCTRITSDAGAAVRFLGKVVGVNGYARSNFIYHLLSSQGSIVAEAGDGSNPSVDNMIVGSNMDGGAVNIDIIVSAGARCAVMNPRVIQNQVMQSLVAISPTPNYTQTNAYSKDALNYFENTVSSSGAFAANLYSNSGKILKLYNPTVSLSLSTTTSHVVGQRWQAVLTETGMYWTGYAGTYSAPSFSSKVERVTAASKTLNASSSILLVDASAGNRTVILPLANQFGAGRSNQILVRRIDGSANTVTVQRQSSDTLNDSVSETLAIRSSKTYVSDATSAWYSY